MSIVTALGMLPPLLAPGIAAAVASAVLFGGSFMASAAAFAIIPRQLLPPALLASGVALLTVGFASGQAAGPLLSGLVTDLTGSVATGLWAAPVILVLAAAISLLQPHGTRIEIALGEGPRERQR